MAAPASRGPMRRPIPFVFVASPASEDHAAEAGPVAEVARAGGGDDIPARHGAEHGGRRPERLAQADREVEDDEGPRARERAFPGGVRDQEAAHVGIAPEHPPVCETYARTPSKTRPWRRPRAGRRPARGTRQRRRSPRRGTGTAPRQERAPRRRSAPSPARGHASGAARSAPGRRAAPAAGRGRGRGTAVRRRSRRRRRRRRAAPSSRGSA